MGMDLTREAVGFAAGIVSTIVIGGGSIYFINGHRTGTRFLFAGDSYSQYQKRIEDAVGLYMHMGARVLVSKEEAKKAVKESKKVFGLKDEKGKIVKGNADESVTFEAFAKLVNDADKFNTYSKQEQNEVWNAYNDNVRKKLGELCGKAFW